MARTRLLAAAGVFAGLATTFGAGQASAINIVVDYTYDTNGFFATQASQDAMQAVADRYSAIITSSLGAIGPAGNGTTGAGWRIGFTHPGTGVGIDVSTAANAGADPLSGSGTADVYGFAGLNANEWILYAGGRSLGSAGVGGTGTGLNFTSTFQDPNGPHRRGVITPTPGDGVGDLPVWGGSISFDSSRTWDFSLDSAGGAGSDFYSIALHEVGHALGLASGWNQWDNFETNGGSTFVGPNTLAAYNADNGTGLTELDLVSTSNPHWEDGTYDSFIFESAGPNYNGTVGPGVLQDLLMEPTANFTGSIDRFELTNTDVATLEDLGWTVVPEPSSFALLFLGGALVARRRRG